MSKRSKYSEAKFITNILRPKLEELGWYIHKSAERFQRGWPDLVCIRGNKTIFAEVKIDNKVPTPLQHKTLVDIAKIGGQPIVITYDNKTNGVSVAEMMCNGELNHCCVKNQTKWLEHFE